MYVYIYIYIYIYIYSIIVSNDRRISLPISKWNKDLNSDYTDLDLVKLCKDIFVLTINPRIQWLLCKILYRVHITKSKLSHMGFASTHTCTYCHNSLDDYIHSFGIAHM